MGSVRIACSTMRRLARILVSRRTAVLLVVLGLVSLLAIHQLGTPAVRSSRAHSRSSRRQEEYTDRRGMRVVVGHYVEEEAATPNYTHKELNANRCFSI